MQKKHCVSDCFRHSLLSEVPAQRADLALRRFRPQGLCPEDHFIFHLSSFIFKRRALRAQAFTLVELLVVIGIIVLLAGLGIPAIQSAKTRGMITQAKADMSAIKMALSGVERDYKTMLKVNSSYNVTGGSIAKNADSYDSGNVHVVRYNSGATYNALIMELSVPRDVSSSNKNFNARNIKYLDPRADYSSSDDSTLWRDPWGNPYDINICTDSSEKVYIPYTSSKVLNAPANHDGSNLVLRGKVFIYSYGPNGTDDGSFNADNGGKSSTDDIRGWEK